MTKVYKIIDNKNISTDSVYYKTGGQWYNLTNWLDSVTTDSIGYNRGGQLYNLTTWLNSVYPLDSIYPVGSVYVSDTNTDPSTSFGGTWELIDKEFASYYTTTSSAITWNSTNTTPASCTMRVARAGHSLNFTFTVNNKVQIKDDTLAIGQLNLASLGIDQIPIIQDITGWTDGGNCAVFFYVSQAGAIETRDVIPDSYVLAGNSTAFSFTAVINTGHMLDAACSKFYWKRTA